MEKKTIAPTRLAQAVGPFVRAVQVDGLVFVSGTSALTHLDGPLRERQIKGDIVEQTRQTLDNIGVVLEDVGGSFEDVVKMTVILKRPEDYEKMNSVRGEYFRDIPVTSTTFVADMVRDDMLVEIDAIALVR